MINDRRSAAALCVHDRTASSRRAWRCYRKRMPREHRGEQSPIQPMNRSGNPVHLFPEHPEQRAVPLTEAAAQLGIARAALRMRVKRGTLPAEKRDGQWYVYLAPGEHPHEQRDEQQCERHHAESSLTPACTSADQWGAALLPIAVATELTPR